MVLTLPSVRQSVSPSVLFFSATPLKLRNSISWKFVVIFDILQWFHERDRIFKKYFHECKAILTVNVRMFHKFDDYFKWIYNMCIRVLPIFDYDFLSNCQLLMHGIWHSLCTALLSHAWAWSMSACTHFLSLYLPWTKFRGVYRGHSVCPFVCADSCPAHIPFFGWQAILCLVRERITMVQCVTNIHELWSWPLTSISKLYFHHEFESSKMSLLFDRQTQFWHMGVSPWNNMLCAFMTLVWPWPLTYMWVAGVSLVSFTHCFYLVSICKLGKYCKA